MYTAYLLLGSNLGDRTNHIATAAELIGKTCGEISSVSAIYHTAPWGNTKQDSFLNQAVKLHTPLSPMLLLHAIKKIETQTGRTTTEHWGPRIIDIDILFYKEICWQQPELHIPHREIANRRFALTPLAEIAASETLFPLTVKISTLLSQCTDDSKVELFLEQ